VEPLGLSLGLKILTERPQTTSPILLLSKSIEARELIKAAVIKKK